MRVVIVSDRSHKDLVEALMELERVSLPVALMLFMGLAVLLPALRVRRRTGVWPIVVGRSVAPFQRWMAWAVRLFVMGLFAWLALYAFAGPAAVGVVPRSAALGVAGWALIVASLVLIMVAQAQMGAAWRIGIDERPTP